MGRCKHTVNHLDFYGKTVGFHYDGQDKLRSFTGSLLSIVVFTAILLISATRLLQSTNERY